ncbi:universal stress protein [Oceanospirillum sediminis]|uniref:Universal stress protein n=1 Tax=Oceanospirillum sediminis TaxID=2760088 RepID=A0A839IZK4_9GAMM|nr:universal stress protein [Oceanospirillum sediminis]MBB1489516.1 universal stress protein [Oceanospirillum sediminis]
MLPAVKKILYASDIEKGSRPAFRAAVSLCGHYHSEITYLHVIEQLSSSAESLIKNMVDHDESLHDLQEQSLEHLKQKLQARINQFCESELEENEMLSEGQVKTLVREGKPWKEILKAADEIDADVIVMGIRSHSSVGQFLLGSTANKVMNNSKRPVLMVPLADQVSKLS